MAENNNKQPSRAPDKLDPPPSYDEDLTELKRLALQAADLARNLETLRSDCGHESTSADIASIASELRLLSTEIEILDHDVTSNSAHYTPVFREDLAELQSHMAGIFEDVADCCEEMRKADGPNTSTMGWMHKKRYVRKLQKHLEANKTSLIVMRTVLHHGKDYGTNNPSGHFLAERNPHILNEDYAILLSVHATRNAWKDLQDYASKSHDHSSSTSSAGTSDTPVFEPGPHGRNLSAATGVDTLDVPDVIPVRATSEKKERNEKDDLTRKLSRRGVRLAVHSSILDLDAHRVPLELRKRWMHQVARRRSADQGVSHAWPSIAALSKISEVNSSNVGDDNPGLASAVHRSLSTPEESHEKEKEVKDEDKSSSRRSDGKSRFGSLSLSSSSLGRKFGKIVNRFTTGIGKKKKSKVLGDDDSCGKAGEGWFYRLTKSSVSRELTTPDFEDVEYPSNALR